MSNCKKKFWFDNVSELFSTGDIMINKSMSFEDKMNSLTRITIYIFFLLLIFKCKNSFMFLIFSLLIIIIIYYINKKQMKKDNYEMFRLQQHVDEVRRRDTTFEQKSYNVPYRDKIVNKQQDYINQQAYIQQQNQQQNQQQYNDMQNNQINEYQQTEAFTQLKPLKRQSDIRSERSTYITPKPQPQQKSRYINMNQNIKPNKIERQFTTPVYLFENETKNNVILDTPTSYILTENEMAMDVNNPTYASKNQALVGKVNPRTLIAPVIVPPLADLGYWKTNNLVTHSLINDQKQTDIYLSGYQVTTDCKEDSNYSRGNKYFMSNTDKPQTYLQRSNSYASNRLKNNSKPIDNFSQVKENFEKYPYMIAPKENGQINTSCGYDPNQIKLGLPSNLKVGKCAKDPIFKEYNDNLFTQTIQPGVYTKSEINEPINSNIGISFDQQFLPTTYEIDNENILYTKHDPRIFDSSVFENDSELQDSGVNAANVYDPRFSGYGTSYRSYTDDNIGQTRFYYDDVDSVRMPNYISRSNIDFALFADSYGPMVSERGNLNNAEIRKLADRQFLDSAIEFRTGMQERLMRKTNANAWQQRVAPLTKNSQRMMGGFRI